MFEQLHTETTSEKLKRLGFAHRKPGTPTAATQVKGGREIVDESGTVLFTGNCFAVNDWLRTAMPIELEKVYPGLNGYYYKLVRGGPPFDRGNWLVRYGTTAECGHVSAICSKTPAYRGEAEQFIRDHLS